MDERRRRDVRGGRGGRGDRRGRRLADVIAVLLILTVATFGVAQKRRALRAEQRLEEALELRNRAERQRELAEVARDDTERLAEAERRRRTLAETNADETMRAAVEHGVLADLATGAFSELDPSLARTSDPTLVRVLLETATRRLDDQRPLDPALEASVRGSLAEACGAVHLLEPAAEQLRLALALLADVPSTAGGVVTATAAACSTLATRLRDSGDLPNAARWQTRALEACRTHHGEADTRTRTARLALADTLREMGQLGDAELLLRAAYDANREALGKHHPETVDAVHRLGHLLAARRRPAMAEQALRHALDVAREESFAPAVVDEYARVLGRFLDEQGLAVEAEPLLRDTVNAARRSFAEDDLRLAGELMTLGRNLLRQRKFVAAEGVLRECLARRRQILDGGHWLVAEARSSLGEALCGQRRFQESETLLLEGYEQLNAAPISMVEPRREAVRRLVTLYRAWGRSDDAERWMDVERN